STGAAWMASAMIAIIYAPSTFGTFAESAANIRRNNIKFMCIELFGFACFVAMCIVALVNVDGRDTIRALAMKSLSAAFVYAAWFASDQCLVPVILTFLWSPIVWLVLAW